MENYQMNRTQRMDDFIKSIANIAQSDPILHISDRLVYHELLVRDLEKEEINKYFPYWIERFKNTPNIEVKNTEKWKYFCRFENEESINDFFLQDAIKMYIPLKAGYIYEGANLLFDFIANENIVHSSKIGSKVRRDDIVIRVYSLKDAQKIQKFVIENEYIRSGLIMPNPFL